MSETQSRNSKASTLLPRLSVQNLNFTVSLVNFLFESVLSGGEEVQKKKTKKAEAKCRCNEASSAQRLFREDANTLMSSYMNTFPAVFGFFICNKIPPLTELPPFSHQMAPEILKGGKPTAGPGNPGNAQSLHYLQTRRGVTQRD